ncbi:rhodanese-like domain-containing protein [Thalassotalea litorea]|uniref:Rhodanese-like domain-containing protein n=1 Tax=Thalassotalea litorea TaxID=2020715 RepID=A0A5R9IRG7_9GAMM|nr:rhodanese-like domain-containing protein [Thalassotalea litorea]TLU66647.1 rhodanese-like domain-containing protein [Thalassotalea litorea]
MLRPLTLFFVLLLCACAEKFPVSQSELPEQATQSQVLALMESKEDFLLLDVRSPEEYNESHITGAVNIPHDTLDQNQPLLKSYRGKNIVVYCRSGRRAQMAIDTLKENNFQRVSHLEGDFQQWQANELPLTKESIKTTD